MRGLDVAQQRVTGSFEWFYDAPESEVDLGEYRGSILSAPGRHREAADTLSWVLERMDPRQGDLAWPGSSPPSQSGQTQA